MISIKDLKKKFGSLEVLKGLNLEVKTGETLVILGRSGVGKSVLLKHILGISKPDSGTVEVDGLRIDQLHGEELLKAVRNMGMLFQGGALFDSMDIEGNVGFYLSEYPDLKTGKKLSKGELKDRVDESLHMVALDGVNHKMPSELSGGMKKRAALARLIAYRPSILLYDEPTTGLDPITAMQINELIVKTQQELKATSIVVTHDIQSALFVCDRLALHKDGLIAHVAEPEEFLQIDDEIIRFLNKTISSNFRSLRAENGKDHLKDDFKDLDI